MSETRAPCAISGDLHILRSCYKLRDKIYNGYADFKKPTLELLKIKLKFPSPWRKNQTSITLKQIGLQSGFSYFACSCNFVAVASLPDKIDFLSSLQSYSGRYEDLAKRNSAPQAGKRENTKSFTRSRNMVFLFFLSFFFRNRRSNSRFGVQSCLLNMVNIDAPLYGRNFRAPICPHRILPVSLETHRPDYGHLVLEQNA